MVADYEGHSPEYLELVGSITREIRKEDYRAELLNATDTGEVIAATEKYE
jgi:mannitol/fructose-specific phosphotransferase system IIA component (Ntr-type)